MSEMIERVAEAIYRRKTGSSFIGHGAGPEHDLAFDLARAAIEAMLEPTAKMLANATMSEITEAEVDDAAHILAEWLGTSGRDLDNPVDKIRHAAARNALMLLQQAALHPTIG